MRKAVGAAALLALFLLVVLLTLPHDPQEVAGSPKVEGGALALGITSAELADSANGSVAVLRVYLGGGRNASLVAFCQEKPLQKTFVVLEHPAVPGLGEGLQGKIGAALSRSGASFLAEDAATAANGSNSVVLSATGAVPSELFAAREALLAANTRVVVLGALDGKAIDSSGNVKPENLSLLPANFELVGHSAGEEAAISEMVRRALVPQGADAAVAGASPGNLTIVLAAKGGSRCRVLASNGSGTRFADTRILEAQSGRLRGPNSIIAGSEAEFYFAPDFKAELGRELGFRAVARGYGKEELANLPSGTITEGYESRFSMRFLSGGKYVVRVFDQFGRQHAAAYLEARGLEARLVGIEGQRHEYELALGGAPFDGKVLVSLDSGEAKELPASNGRVFVYAAPSGGNHTMGFSYKGASAKSEFFSSQEGFLAAYAKYSGAGALALAAFYLVLRAGKKPKYVVKFPEYPKSRLQAVEVSQKDFLGAYGIADRRMGGHGLPMYADEIASCLKAGESGALADPSSTLCCLAGLVKQGVFCENEGAFIPKSRLRGFLPWELFALRLVHDLLLERGQGFERKRRTLLRGGKAELCLFPGKGQVLSGMRKGVARVLVFPSEEGMGAFLEGMKGTGREDAMARIAYWNGALLPVVASRKELEPLIP